MYRQVRVAICILCLASVSFSALARERIGLVLSGGGARGFAHVAVLEALETHRIPIDYIAGTSMGAVVGALYASGLSAAEVRNQLLAMDWSGILTDVTERDERSFRNKSFEGRNFLGLDLGVSTDGLKLPLAALKGQKLALVLNGLTLETVALNDFDRFPIPFRAVTTDLATGEARVLRQGSLATALRASMAVPVVFSPVEIEGRLYVDGGVANNLPMNVARDMGAERLIVVDTSSQKYSTAQLTSVVTVVDQLTNLLTQRNTEAQLATLTEADVLFEIFPENVGTADFNKVEEALAAGRQEVLRQTDRLASFSVDEATYQAWSAQHLAPRETPNIAFVEVKSDAPRTSSKVIANRMSIRPGQPLDERQLKADLEQIYALETIDRVEVGLRETDAGVGLTLETREKAWGPDYLDVGFTLEDSLDGRSAYNLHGVLRVTNINPLGGEWRTEATLGHRTRFHTELYQPVDYGSDWFASAVIRFMSEERALYDAGDMTALYQSEIREFGFDGGYSLDTRGELRVGFRQSSTENTVRLGVDSLAAEVDDSRYFVQAGYDTLDSFGFPTSGLRLLGEYAIYDAKLGATRQYDGITLDVLYPFWSRGRTTLVGQAYFGYLFESAVTDVNARYSLGGFTRLSGFSPDEISGRHAGLISLIGYQRLNDPVVFPVDQPVYVGASLEAGNVFQDREDIVWRNVLSGGSVFIGADTVLGPGYLSFGRTEGGRQSITLSVGRPFAEHD